MLKRLLVIALAGSTLVGCNSNNTLSSDVYSASEAKQVQRVTYGTLVHVRPVKIQGGKEDSMIGAVGGAILGGFLGNTVGGGTGRNLATAAGAVAGGVAGDSVQGAMNTSNGVELEIRQDDGTTVLVVQKQSASLFSVGQRVMMASNGSQVTVSPR